jgi:hypothetical protein
MSGPYCTYHVVGSLKNWHTVGGAGLSSLFARADDISGAGRGHGPRGSEEGEGEEELHCCKASGVKLVEGSVGPRVSLTVQRPQAERSD